MRESLVRTMLAPLLLVVALTVAACSAATAGDAPAEDSSPGKVVQAEGGSYREIDVTELQAMLQDKDFVLVNTHIPFEGDIPGTDVSVPYNDIESYLDQLPQDKDAKIVVYCRTGAMSRAAARTLVKLGYTNVWDVPGGMVAWQQSGQPLEGR